MITIRLQSGKEATLEDGTWSSDDPSLAELLGMMMQEHGPTAFDGDPELACGHRIAGRLHAEVVAFRPEAGERLPGVVY